MTSSHTNASQRSVRHRGASIFATLLTLIAGLVLVAPDAASAADFAITTPDGTLFTSSTVTVTGTKAPDGRVEVPSLTGGDPYCIIADASEEWSCTLNLADGSSTLTAREFAADPDAAPLETAVTLRVLGAPTIDGNEPTLTTGIISGTGLPGAGILVTGTGPESISTQCTTVQTGGFWSCPLPVTTSGQYSVSVQQLWPGTGEGGGTAGPRTVIVDKQAPPPPVITSPTAGSRVVAQPTTYAGTGENGSRVDVFVDSVLVCSATVTGTTWSCAASGVAPGDRLVQAIQWDAAGNPSGASQGVRVAFGPPSSDGGGGTTPGNPSTPDPSTPTTPEQPVPAPIPSPTQTPSPTPAPSLPFFPPPVGGDSGLPPLDTWGTPTYYGAAIPAIWSSQWLEALLIALAFVLLLALPLRLLFTTLRGRVEPRVARFAGRNREDNPDDRPLFSPWTVAAVALAAAILLAALAGGVQGEVRYLRLIIGLGIALVALNGLGVALPTKLSSGALGSRTGIRLVPVFLGIAALTALVSRGGGVQPPVIVGVVIAATFAADAGLRTRGVVSLVQLATITLLGLWAWLGHTALGPQEGFVLSLVSETLAGLCIAAFGSVMLLLLPVWRMPGRYLFDWSWPAWLVTALVAGVLASAVIGTSETFPLPWALGVAFVFAAASVATWAWIRWVEPQLIARDA